MRTRIALFGLGRIGQIHLENIIINPRLVLLTVKNLIYST